MILKFLLTVAVILGGAWFVIAKWRTSNRPRVAALPASPLLPAGMARAIAYTVIGLMAAGSGWYLYSSWAAGNAVMTVQVVNANTGVITPYQALRRDIEGRGFRTLDGRDVRLADVERMILEPASSHQLPTAGPTAPGR